MTLRQLASFDELAKEYCERQQSTPTELRSILQSQIDRFNPDGWFLAECQVLDSSLLGSYVILPYGPNNTFRNVPDHPFSPRGLASDMSVAVAFLPIAAF